MPPRATYRTKCALAALALVAPAACLSWSELERGACGDGFVGREEACDDANRISGDGCSDACRLEPAVCGDGRKDPAEDCDDANAFDGDACLSGCRAASCGDGRLWEFEEACDDGNLLPGDGCSAACELEPISTGPRCGNAELDAPEPCDDGDADNSDACLNGCSLAACGDGVTRLDVEECDEGGPENGCTRGCMLCGPAWGSYYRLGNSHCYTVHDEPSNQQRARATCQAEGGDLWTVTSQAEGVDAVQKLGLSGRYWLGLQTTSTGRSWISGEDTQFTSFATGEPSDVGLRCVSLEADSAGAAWHSQGCNTLLGFVCERAPATVFPTNHHAYRLHTALLDAAAARQRCEQDGGKLATLETDAERLFVGKAISVTAWLDASDAAEEGVFRWASGEAVDRSVFALGQPDDADRSQGCLLFNPGDKLADAACSEPHAYVCEIE